MSGTGTVTSPPDVATPRRPTASRLVWFGVAVVVAAIIALASIAFGARLVGWHEIATAFTGDETGIAQAAVQKRVPRTLLALLIGAALGLSGAVMQGVTRNPLADPGILGVTNGVALAVVTGIAFFSMTSPTAYIFVAVAARQCRRSSSTRSAPWVGAVRPRSSSRSPVRPPPPRSVR